MNSDALNEKKLFAFVTAAALFVVVLGGGGGGAALSALPAAALAQSQANLPLIVGQGAGGTSYSVPIQTLLVWLICQEVALQRSHFAMHHEASSKELPDA